MFLNSFEKTCKLTTFYLLKFIIFGRDERAKTIQGWLQKVITRFDKSMWGWTINFESNTKLDACQKAL